MPSLDLSPPPPTEADLETLRVVGVRGSRDYAVAPLARAVLYLLHRDQERETFQRNVDDYFMDLTQQVEALQSIAQGNLESGTPNPSFTTEPCNAGAAGGEGAPAEADLLVEFGACPNCGHSPKWSGPGRESCRACGWQTFVGGEGEEAQWCGEVSGADVCARPLGHTGHHADENDFTRWWVDPADAPDEVDPFYDQYDRASLTAALNRERAAHQALRDDLRQERDIIALGHIDGNPPTVAAICARLSRLLDPPAPDPATVDGP